MSTRAPVTYKEAIKFCHYHLGRDCFAAFTGADWPAWISFVYLLELYGRSSYRGSVIEAMKATLRCAQNREDIHQLFVQAIPAVLDWSDAAKIWPELRSDWEGANWNVTPMRRRRS